METPIQTGRLADSLTTCGTQMYAPPDEPATECSRSAGEDGRCIFHSEEKDPSAFRDGFRKLVRQAHKENQDLDCTRFVFPALVLSEFDIPGGNQPKVTAHCRFDHARFTADASFQSVTFAREVSFHDAVFEGVADFANTRFNAMASFMGCEFQGPARFIRTHLDQGGNFQSAAFRASANFTRLVSNRGTVNFKGSQFDGEETTFHNPILNSPAIFAKATFEGALNFAGGEDGRLHSGPYLFRGTQFRGPVDFKGLHFQKGAADFIDASFQKVEFHGARFDSILDFRDASLDGTADLRGLAFDHGISFERTTIAAGARLNLEACEIASDAVFVDLRFPPPEPGEAAVRGPDVRLDFRSVQIRETALVRFQGIHDVDNHDQGRGRLDLSKALFAHTDVALIRFHNVKWLGTPAWRGPLRREAPIERLADEHYLRQVPGGRTYPEFQPDEEKDWLNPRLVADIYKGLRISYEDSRHFPEAGIFHVREMQMKRLDAWQEAKNRGHWWPGIQAWRRLHLSVIAWYGFTSQYGEKYGRALSAVAAWFVVMAVFREKVRPRLSISWLPDWLQAMLRWLHSLSVDAIQLVPGQVAGDSVTDFLARFVGVFLIATFIIALRRNFRR